MSTSSQNGGATAAPPPTPSSQTTNHFPTPDTADLLSRLLHRLPPTLSLPTRRTSSADPPPSISFINPSPDALLNHRGFFQLIDHLIPPQLARAAESDSVSLFNLAPEKKRVVFVNNNWPIGFDHDEIAESFCVDASAATELGLSSLAELTRELEKIGLKMIDLLMSGFNNPTRESPSKSKLCSLMWVSADEGSGPDQDQVMGMGRVYPYVVGLTYQLTSQRKYSLLGDSGWVTVSPRVDSVLVTVGDIAQVWSNGLFKKVRGRPVPNVGGDSGKNNENSPSCITMTLLVTLEADSIVQPLVPLNAEQVDETEASTSSQTSPADFAFKPFPFEDYAWRTYNECILLKDPLNRYRN